MGAALSTTPQPSPENDGEKAHAPSGCSALKGRIELVGLVESHCSHVPCQPSSSKISHGGSPYLCVLRGDLQHESQTVVVKVFVKGQECSMHPALNKVVCVLAEPDGLDPVNDLVIGPHQHICKRAGARFKAAQTVLLVVQ